ncbi:hypothetical protein [Paraburkholderia phenoliruptrix]|uniref:hypothetical protein n=1 Tax=Paraburkholderia phenoliruptrix TaxID=252970 RepID=UPI001C6F4895|nr:hypothetical protein [Paraburkholderia phenoliruptrix]MBW9104496.1 hypothetical protein [Paraburkholderia phenoliruptrix]
MNEDAAAIRGVFLARDNVQRASESPTSKQAVRASRGIPCGNLPTRFRAALHTAFAREQQLAEFIMTTRV